MFVIPVEAECANSQWSFVISQSQLSILKSLKIQIKKAACFFGRLRSDSFQQIVNSKCPLTCPVLSSRPPPAPRIVAVHLPHNQYIKSAFPTFVKTKTKKFTPLDNGYHLRAMISHEVNTINTQDINFRDSSILQQLFGRTARKMRRLAPLLFDISRSPQTA
jgi:hypothetical protein